MKQLPPHNYTRNTYFCTGIVEHVLMCACLMFAGSIKAHFKIATTTILPFVLAVTVNSVWRWALPVRRIGNLQYKHNRCCEILYLNDCDSIYFVFVSGRRIIGCRVRQWCRLRQWRWWWGRGRCEKIIEVMAIPTKNAESLPPKSRIQFFRMNFLSACIINKRAWI